MQLYHCFDGAEENRVDWREVVCSLYAFDSTGHVHSHPIKLLTSFFRLYSLPTTNANIVPRVDVIRMISLAATTHAEFTAVSQIGHHLPDMVKLTAFREALIGTPQVTEAFRSQLWKRLPDLSKLTYLQLQEDATARWFEGYIHQQNMKKAVKLRKQSLLCRSFRGWCQLSKKMRIVKIQRRIVLLRKCRALISWWNLYAVERRASFERRQVAAVLGHRALVRRVVILRWHRWSCNERRVRHISGAFRRRAVDVSHGSFLVRRAMACIYRRDAIQRWSDWIKAASQADGATKLMRKLLVKRFFAGWHSHVHFVKLARTAEEDSIRNQIYLTAMIQGAGQELAATIMADEQNQRSKREDGKQRALSDKLHTLAWKTRRRQAEHAADDRVKLAVQQDARAKRIAENKEDRAASFHAAWAAIERQYIEEQRLATRRWLDSGASKNHVSKEFKRIKREFYRPPTPRSMERERNLKALSSIVLIKMEAILFQKGIVMEHFIRQYDEDSSGFLSHNEFRSLVKDLPIDLSAEQIRLVIHTLDSDHDGYVGLKELEKALDIVHAHNGVSASPWRMYVDPAQDVICYHNLATDELIFEHRMSDRKLMEVTKSNFLAETELEAINHVRRQRALVRNAYHQGKQRLPQNPWINHI
tara:strand:- start:400 stop:2334 length:1935 start_codon:yes stop_codon:yes gene_type:complete